MAMRVARGAILLLVAVGAAGLALGGLAARNGSGPHELSLATQASDLVAATAAVLSHAIERALARSPAAMIGIAFGLALPVVGVTLLLVRWLAAAALSLRLTQAQTARPEAPDSGPVWLEVQRPRRHRILLGAELHRIGRDADSDLHVSGPDIADTHALIRRTSEQEFHLIDVSGAAGALIEINGQRRRQAALRDGDQIAVGSTQAIFHHGHRTDGVSPRSRSGGRTEPRTSP